MQVMEERPPYVRFEQRAEKDGEKTRETGIYSYKDVIYVLVTPAGSKDVYEQNAENWLAKQRKLAEAGRIPEANYQYFKNALERYKEGLETPESGTPIKGWSAISPAQQAVVLQANVRTVEDLAAAPEDALSMIGMGARSLKQKAEAWLKSGERGKAANQMQDMEKKLEAAEREKEKQAATIQKLVERVEAMESGSEGVEVPVGEEVEMPEEPKLNKDGSVRKKPGRKPKSN